MFALLIAYALSGILSTLTLQQLSVDGALNPYSLLGSFPAYLGSYLVGVLGPILDTIVLARDAPPQPAQQQAAGHPG
jgi:hypothetical protein